MEGVSKEHTESYNSKDIDNDFDSKEKILTMEKKHDLCLFHLKAKCSMERYIFKHERPDSFNPTCEFYKIDKCRFGDHCKFRHDSVAQSKKAAKKTQKFNNETKKVICEEIKPQPRKKCKLRTVQDVIKRINFDDNLNSELFSVGYVDRFEGVLEKSFESFCWKHLALADLEELAIPYHRIEYIKYKGKIVWSKSERYDAVFGSNNTNKTINELMKEVDAEEEEERRRIKQEEDLEDSDEWDEEFNIQVGSCDSQSAIMNAISSPDDEERLRATHFLCIRVTDQEVIRKVKEVQNHIFQEEPILRNCAMPEDLLHITLAMVNCVNDDAVGSVTNFLDEAKYSVQELKHLEINGYSDVIRAERLSTFGARVLYTQLNVPPMFQKVVNLLQNRLKKHTGVIITNHFDFVPHMTLMKVNRQTARARRSKYINSSQYCKYLDCKFGTIRFDNIHFCTINDFRGPDGFYLTYKKINF